jgi:hypothetical protein
MDKTYSLNVFVIVEDNIFFSPKIWPNHLMDDYHFSATSKI